jgi:hypothetical protein
MVISATNQVSGRRVIANVTPILEGVDRVIAEFFPGLEQKDPVVKSVRGICTGCDSGNIDFLPCPITQA